MAHISITVVGCIVGIAVAALVAHTPPEDTGAISAPALRNFLGRVTHHDTHTRTLTITPTFPRISQSAVPNMQFTYDANTVWAATRYEGIANADTTLRAVQYYAAEPGDITAGSNVYLVRDSQHPTHLQLKFVSALVQ